MSATGEEAVTFNQFSRVMNLTTYEGDNFAISMKKAKGLIYGEPIGSVDLPEGYTQIEYIQSSGNQIIDTGWAPNNNTRVVMDIEILKSNGTYAVFGGRSTMNTDSFSVFIVDGKFRSDYGTKSVSTNISASGRFTIDKNKNIFIVNGEKFTNDEATFFSSRSIALFTVNGSANSSWEYDDRYVTAKLYSCTIYAYGDKVRELIPAKNSSGLAGLFDLIENTFYTDVNFGAFTAGPEVLPTEDEGQEIDNFAIKLSQLKRLYFYLNPPIPDFVNPITGSWSDLAGLSSEITSDNLQYYKDYYTPFLGQKREISDGWSWGTREWELIGVCNDTKTDGTTAMLTWSCLSAVTSLYMSSSTNDNRPSSAHNWEGSYPRSYLMYTYINRLPNDLVPYIAEVSKKCTPGYNGATVTQDKLWILSKAEVGLGGGVGTAYPNFYSNSNNRRLRKAAPFGGGPPRPEDPVYGTWFLRTVYGYYEFDRIDEDGTFLTGGPSTTHGVVPNFCI